MKTEEKSLTIFMPTLDKMEPKQDDPINEKIPCECGSKDHKAGLIVKKWGVLSGPIKDKLKIQIFEGDEIKSVVIDKVKLMEKIKELK